MSNVIINVNDVIPINLKISEKFSNRIDNFIIKECGENILKYKVVIINNDNFYIADKNNLTHINRIVGISLNNGSTGMMISVIPHNEITNLSWNWNLSKNIYLGNNGNLTQEIPENGFIQEIGFPTKPNTMFIFIRNPIIIS